MANGTPLGAMYIELGLDASKFSPTLNGAKRTLNYFRGELKGVDAALRQNGDNTVALQAKYKTLGNAIEAQKKYLDELHKSFKNATPGTAEWEKSAVQIQNENAKLVALEAQLDKTASAFRRASSQEGFTGFLQRAGNHVDSFGSKLQTLSAKTAFISGGMAAGIGLTAKAAIEFESAFAGVKKTVDETATVSYTKLSNGIRQMAKELPASATEIAHVAEAAGQLGIKTEDVLKFSRTMIDMGESTNLSADEAATAIAKIANILGLSSEDYSRFGASVVDLGNNFATTEKDIVEMTNRLAAAGKLAGLTAPDILGLATAMSSVGIEAEAGGTAMTQTLTAIGNAVSLTGKDAEDKLNLIAETAGMTAEEFQQAWKEKPVEALQSFIKGLQNAHNEGKNMNGILDDLDMKGVRQSNMLKSLALASDKMGAAVKRSNEAWKNNTALTDEANKRYATTESKLKIFKNKLTDIAIEIGGPVIDALSSMLDAGEPIIKMIEDLAKSFTSMDPATQRMIVNIGLGVAAFSPLVKILGVGTSALGKFINITGKISGSLKSLWQLAGLAGPIEKTTTAISSAGTATVETGTAVTNTVGTFGKLTSIVTGLTNPIGLLVGGTTLLAGGMVALGLAQDEARQKFEKFGTDLDGSTRNQLEKFKVTVDKTKEAVKEFATEAGDAEKVSVAFKKLYDDISDTAQKANQKVEGLATKWGLSSEQVQRAKDHNNQIVQNAETMMNQINEIYQRHNGEARNFSKEEKEIILNNQREMIKAKLELMDLSKKQEKAILQAFNGEVRELNETQLKDSKESLKKMMAEEDKAYKNSKKELKTLLDEKALTKQEYNRKMVALDDQHNRTMEALGTKYYDVMMALDSKLKTRTGQSWNYWEEAKKTLKEYGISYDEIAKKASEAGKNVGQSHSLLADYSRNMSKETKEANDAWSLLVGNINKNNQFEVKSNVKEVIGEATKSAEGWEQFKFIAKHANLTTNARAIIAEALVESGKWSSMTIEEKTIVVNGKKGLLAIFDSEEHLKIWNSLPTEVKNLLLNNNDVMNKAKVAKEALENYNALSPRQKELIAKDENIRTAVARSTETLKKWDATNPFPKDLKVNAETAIKNTKLGFDQVTLWNEQKALDKKLIVDSTPTLNSIGVGIAKLNDYNNTSVASKKLDADAQSVISAGNTAIEKITGFNALVTPTKNLSADSSSAVSGGQSAVDALNNFNNTSVPVKPLQSDASSTQAASNTAINAVGTFNGFPAPTKQFNGNASSTISESNKAIGSINSFNGLGVPTKQINAQDNASGVASGVISWFNSIPRTVTTVIETVRKWVGLESGTNYHTGGPAVVNDQKGGTYKELIRFPSGETFIPEGRNVLMDLPRGTKVFPAYKTQRLMRNMGIPKYANGVGIPSDARFLREMEQATTHITNQTTVVNTDANVSEVVSEIAVLRSSLEKLLTAILEKPSEILLDGETIAQNVYHRQGKIIAREGI